MPSTLRFMEAEVHGEYRKGVDYYTLTLTADRDGRPVWSTYTHFRGWAGKPGCREIREASLVEPAIMVQAWTDSGWSVVHDRVDLARYLRRGGHALIGREVAVAQLSFVLEPREAAPNGLLGFETVPPASDAALRRAPSKRLRMEVLKRDGFRCRACGRSAADNVDVDLHVHHVQPFGQGGLTRLSNLLTLCSTCHAGLWPHRDHGLLNLPGYLDEHLEGSDAHTIGVQRYRDVVARRAPA